MVRRGREFDRSDFFRDLFVHITPDNQGAMYTNDQWRWNRKLVADVMSPEFLNAVAAPNLREATMDLIDLWRQNARLAKGHPVAVVEDMKMVTTDTIWAATFGSGIRSAKAQGDFLADINSISLPKSVDELAVVPECEPPEIYEAIKLLAESSEIPLKSPLGGTHHWFVLNFLPSFRRAQKLRDDPINNKLTKAWKLFEQESDIASSSSKVKSALDLLVQKEVALARKEGREPNHESKYIHDELCGFLAAGIDATSSSINWGLKYLTKHQDVQRKLRESLRATFQSAYEAKRAPTAEELAKARCPYLDAFVDEVMRHSGIVSANIRVAMQDAVVLGHVIPKGVDIFMLNNGPSFLEPALHVDEDKRGGDGEKTGDMEMWEHRDDLGKFDPERWLRKTSEGEVEFDSRAAPLQTFELGVRSCYGKKLAYLQMRMIYTLIVWTFELLPVPEALGNFKGKDVLTHQAQNVILRLAEIA